MTQKRMTDRHPLGDNAANFANMQYDSGDPLMTPMQRAGMFILAALLGVCLTLIFGVAAMEWVAKASYLHANPLEGQPW